VAGQRRRLVEHLVGGRHRRLLLFYLIVLLTLRERNVSAPYWTIMIMGW
jgi:hypothetical protein